jgi:hypothetical protein
LYSGAGNSVCLAFNAGSSHFVDRDETTGKTWEGLFLSDACRQGRKPLIVRKPAGMILPYEQLCKLLCVPISRESMEQVYSDALMTSGSKSGNTPCAYFKKVLKKKREIVCALSRIAIFFDKCYIKRYLKI